MTTARSPDGASLPDMPPPVTGCGGFGVGAGTTRAAPAFLLPHKLAAASQTLSFGWDWGLICIPGADSQSPESQGQSRVLEAFCGWVGVHRDPRCGGSTVCQSEAAVGTQAEPEPPAAGPWGEGPW